MPTSTSARNGGGGPGAARVFIIIPVHDRWDLTRQCLEALKSQSYRQVIIVIVDDGSTDGTGEAVARDFSDVVVLRGDGNLWWTGATNLGISWALQRCEPNDYVLTLNNDTTVNTDYVRELVKAARASRNTLIGSVAVDSRDRQTIVDGGPHVNWWIARGRSDNAGRSLSSCLRDGSARSRPDMLPGRGMLVSVECFRQIGLYDARRLPHYAADYEFSVRAARAGYGLVMSYEAPVFCEVEATGISTKLGRMSWPSFFGMLVSRRSPACLLYRWRFAWLAAPRALMPIYLVSDTARVVGGALRDQLFGDRS